MSDKKQNHIEKIFSPLPHIEVDVLLDYMDNKLPHAKKHTVEKALLGDPFLAEALEGLALISREERKKVLYSLLGREQKEALVIPLKTWLVAASVLVGVSTVFLVTRSLLNTTTENFAQQEEITIKEQLAHSNQAIEEKIDSINANKTALNVASAIRSSEESDDEVPQAVVAPKTLDLSLAKRAEESTPSSPSQDSVEGTVVFEMEYKSDADTKSESLQLSSDLSLSDDRAKKTAVSTQKSSQQLASEMVTIFKSKLVIPHLSVSDKMEEGEERSDKSTTSINDTYSQGLIAFKQQQYAQATEKLEVVHKKNANLEDVKFYLTASYLCQNGNVSKAKKIFKPESIIGHTPEKQWIQAIIYLSEGKEDNAKSQLEKIVNSESPYKNEAAHILSQIK